MGISTSRPTIIRFIRKLAVAGGRWLTLLAIQVLQGPRVQQAQRGRMEAMVLMVQTARRERLEPMARRC